MTQALVLVTERERFLHITLNRSDKKNALLSSMYNDMSDALERASADKNLLGVVLTGSGDSFTAGNDMGDFLSIATGSDGGLPEPILRFLKAMAHFEKPLVAAVNGLAIGVGTTLLMHCDMVLALKGARFQLPFVNLACVPEAGSSVLLPALCGQHRAMELVLLAEMFNGERAAELGLVNRCYDEVADMQAGLDEILKILASKPPSALRESKRLLRASVRGELDALIDEEARIFGQQLRSAEAEEALLAFKEKRAPDFSKLA